MAGLRDIRDATPDDVAQIKPLAVAANMFTAEEVDFFDEPLGGFFDGSLEGHRWVVQEREGSESLAAAAYYAPEPFADRMWNLYFLAVAPTEQGQGTGRGLMHYIETALRSLGEDRARTFIVETSSTAQYAQARAFYERVGFSREARIPQFYGPDDDKLVFWKLLVQPAGSQGVDQPT